MILDKVYNMDCIKGMSMIADNSVDAVICDLPYGVLNKSNKGAKWDVIIPFDKLWSQYERIAKENATFVLFAQGMFTAELMQSNKKNWRYNLVWDKKLKSGFLNANRMPLRQHEDICIFYKKLGTYNPQMVKCEPHVRNHGKGKNGKQVNKCYGDFISLPQTISDEKFPSSILTIAKEHFKGSSFHPTQKPVNLLRYLVRTYTNEGDVVLDNCMGSGTTAIACIKEKRHFIGFELDENFYNISCKRINEERAQLCLI